MSSRHEILRSPDISLPKRYINDFVDQGKNPPGEDKIMGTCYQATVKLLEKDNKFRDHLSSVIKDRKMPPQHFTNLFYRSVQYLELFEKNNKQYPDNFTTINDWRKELMALNESHGKKWQELLLTKDTTTTIYQRYAGSKIVLNALFPEKSLRVADFGCGGNYGLTGLSKDMPFQNIVDKTPEKIATELLHRPYTLKEGLAVDKENPDNPEAKKWRLACSFYPQELKGMKELISFEEQLKDVENVKFLQGDLLTLQINHTNGTLPTKYFDAVLLNTMLYQMTYKEQTTVLDSTKKTLNDNGTIVVQDFATKCKTDPTQLDFNVSWFGQPYSYRTYIASKKTDWEMKEVLQWNNGRCKQVRPGEDFNQLLVKMPIPNIKKPITDINTTTRRIIPLYSKT